LTPEIILAGPRHVGEMTEIENSCFPMPWSARQLDRCVKVSDRSRTWAAIADGSVIGYVSVLISDLDLLHIANLAVRPEYRNLGIGTTLMEIAEGWGARLGACAAYLEVRRENELALALYGRTGYRVQTVLRDYYGRGEDGLRCAKELLPDRKSTELCAVLGNALGPVPPTGVILGSGLSWLVEAFGESRAMSTSELPGVEREAVPGHPGRISVSACGRVVFLQGRRHRYQGYDGDGITAFPGALSDLGTYRWILTSSSGGVDPSLRVGDAMVILDHVNLSGCVPSGRPGPTGEGVYSRDLTGLALDPSAPRGRGRVQSGVFASVSGPCYETPAELEFIRSRGISAVSMSITQEALLLSGRGCSVLGLSLISNTAEAETAVTHGDVLEAQTVIRENQEEFVTGLIDRVAGHGLR
jgi:purine-nucleoside phosphorylase